MDSQIEEVKNKVDIVGLVNEYVPLKKSGRNYKAKCPFHNEKTPSFMVSPERQIFKCFGCSEGGDVFSFYKKIEGVEFGEAMKFLAARVGVKLKEYKPTEAEQKKETFLKANDIAAKLYHHLLLKHPSGKRALEYLKARGVKQKAIVDFRLGFAPEKNQLLIEVLKKKGFGISDIISAGLALVIGNTQRDRFRGRVMFPISDTQGRVIAFSGRALGDFEPKYLNSPETPIFSKSKVLYGVDLAKQNLKKEDSAILVEGNLDVISSHQVGVSNVVAPLGTAVTAAQIDILKRWTENLLFAFDTDLAGDAAAKRGIEIAESAGMSIRVVQLPSGTDPDDLIKKNSLEWKKAIKEAVPIYDFFIIAAITKFGVKSAEAKKKVAAATLPEIGKISDEIVKAHYLQTLSSKLGVEEAVLRLTMRKYGAKDPEAVGVKEVLEEPLSEHGKILVEKYLLALILQGLHFPKEADEKILDNPQLKELFDRIKQFVKKEGRLKIKFLVKTIPQPLVPVFDELLLHEISQEILDEEEKIKAEIDYCVNRLKELNLRTKLKVLSLAIKQAEVSGNQVKVNSLSEKFRDLSSVLNSLETRK